ncbi:MAG: MBL fold metallo-hydrolase [Candidatus Altiarchaeota archaeon]
MNSITFLGTGGGRFVFLTQRRYSGGIWFDFDGVRLILDPGPGALVRALQYGKDPGRLDCVIGSHKHLDHYSDIEVMVEAMTHGLNRRKGVLVLQKDVVEYVSDYHRSAAVVLMPDAGETFNVGGLGVEVIPTANHVGGLGFRFMTSGGVVTYSGDTGYDSELVRHYNGSKLLILNTIFPSGGNAATHLNTDDAIQIGKAARPEWLIITHFGVRMLNADPKKEAQRIEEESKVPTTAATDGMTATL